MEFDVLVATRNRQSVLSVSLPLMLSQRLLPSNFIFIDSSDDHQLLRCTAEQIFERIGPRTNLQIIKSPSGISLQRNIGLKYTKAPVIFFPDDDALWYPGMTDAVMRIYERDSESVIGAVCPVASPVPPPEAGLAESLWNSEDGKIRKFFGPFVHSFGMRFIVDPIYIEGHARNMGRSAPQWLSDEGAEVFGPMTGFQMSFRTDVIRKYSFDENLGRYSLFEDRDASLSVLKGHFIVCSSRGKVFHYRVPGKRTEEYEWGLINMLNRAYVVCKHSPPGSKAREKLWIYSLYRLAFYLLRARTELGRQRIRGAWKAISCIPALLSAPQADLANRFIEIRDNCLKGH